MSDYTPPTLVIPTPGGNPGDGSIDGALTINDPTTTPPNKATLKIEGVPYSGGANTYPHITVPNGNQIDIDGPVVISGANPILLVGGFEIFGGVFSNYHNVATVGLGVAPLYGDDVRTGLTAVDSAAKTLYTTTAAGQLYRLMGRILATAGTSPSATYTIKWTEGGATITKTLTISAIDSDSDLSILIQPDNGTAITAQLTAISGTGTTVNVAATVEQ